MNTTIFFDRINSTFRDAVFKGSVIPPLYRYIFLIFGYDVGHVKTRQIRERKLGITGLHWATGPRKFDQFWRNVISAFICLFPANLRMDSKIVWIKDIFEPIAIFFTSLMNDFGVWLMIKP